MRSNLFSFVLLGVIGLAVTIAFEAGGASHKGVSKAETDPDFLTRQTMIQISKQLGVTCTHCHDTKNFKSTALPTWKTAKDHMRVVQLLNSKEGFNGSPKVDCFTCHQGMAKPKNSASINAGLPEAKKPLETAP
jgi:hypothetical protein